jgi:hypothetical protein
LRGTLNTLNVMPGGASTAKVELVAHGIASE